VYENFVCRLVFPFHHDCHRTGKSGINGGIISIYNGAVLVIDNPDNAAIRQTGSGYLISEDSINRVIWSVGGGNGGVYVVPFGNTADYLPLYFSASSGSTDGRITFSTYKTQIWKNSDHLPPGVTNVNGSGGDNSAKIIDRFWQIKPQGYSTKPTLNNIRFTYSDLEYAAPNTIIEGDLIDQRWNSTQLSWADYTPLSVINTTGNTITIASVPGTQLYDWWTLVDVSSPLPVSLLNFNAMVKDKTVVTRWLTASESNTRHFEIWRSKNLQQFEILKTLAAAGHSTSLLNYSITDPAPYNGSSYYRLKTIDMDGTYTWSAIAKVVISEGTNISLYPNPASAYLYLSVSSGIASKRPTAYVYDSKGSVVKSFLITDTYQPINISFLSAGMYRVHFIYKYKPHTLSFTKN